MQNKIQSYLDQLFKEYEDTTELKDFKEEIAANLFDRIHDLKNSGLDEKEAFNKAVAELGDITKVADEVSRQKRNEIIGKMYFQQSPKISVKHAIGFTIAGAVLLFGIITGLITYFSTDLVSHGVSSLMPFLVLSGTALVFLGLTMETSRNFPMSWKRALVYAIAIGSILFGLNNSAMLYFMNSNWNAILGIFIPFIIPAAGIIVFLLLTENKRHKPWVVEEQKIMLETYARGYYENPEMMTKRGLLSGILWILAFGIFAFIWMVAGLKYAFFVFVFAIAGELVIELCMYSKGKKQA